MTFLKIIRSRLDRLSRKPEARSRADEAPPSTGAVGDVLPHEHARVDAVPAAPLPVRSYYPAPPLAEVRQRPTAQALLADLSHYDGFVREAALQRAAELPAPELLPAVVMRLNDWVPQVRRRAQDLVLDWLRTLDADAAVRLLGAVEPLRRAKRSDHSAWLRAFEAAFVAQVGPDRIVGELASDEVGVARACYRLAEDYDLAVPVARIRAGLANRTDIVLASRAAAALAGLAPGERAEPGRIALRSRFGMVRATALRTLLADAPDDADALAVAMLADPHAWTRLVVSTYLGRRGIACAPLYAERIAAPGSTIRTLRACLAGLAEAGDRAYVGVVETMTAHASPRVRIDAYGAWLRLVPADRDALARRILADEARRVRRLALTMRRQHGAFVPADAALALLRERGDVELMLDYVEDDPWRMLALIVELLPASATDPSLRARLGHALGGWSGGYARLNDEAQRALLREPGTRAALLALPGIDGWRAKRLVHELDAL